MPVSQLLWKTLKDLSDHDFGEFKWFLGLEILKGCEKIPKCDLESPQRHLIVGKMVETYGEETAVKMTVAILRLMNHNNSAEQLEKTHREGAAPQERVSRPPVPSSSASGPPTGRKISADGAAGAQLRDDFRGAQAPVRAHRRGLVMSSLGGGLGDDINGFVNSLLHRNLGGSVFTDNQGRNVNNNNPSFVAGNTGGNVGGDIHSIITCLLEGDVGRKFGGNVFTRGVSGNLQSNFNGIVKGDVSGNVGDNFCGFIRGSVYANLGNNFRGVVEGDVCGSIGSNFRGVVTGDVAGHVGSNFNGILMGDVCGSMGKNFRNVPEGNIADYIREVVMTNW